MYKCPECKAEFKSLDGLWSHLVIKYTCRCTAMGNLVATGLYKTADKLMDPPEVSHGVLA